MNIDISVFEAGMLICFGLAWPLSIIKSIRSKSTKGKSLFFLFVILIGYISGITHKLFYSQDLVLILYVINFLMVLMDILLYRKNHKREKAIAAQTV